MRIHRSDHPVTGDRSSTITVPIKRYIELNKRLQREKMEAKKTS